MLAEKGVTSAAVRKVRRCVWIAQLDQKRVPQARSSIGVINLAKFPPEAYKTLC